MNIESKIIINFEKNQSFPPQKTPNYGSSKYLNLTNYRDDKHRLMKEKGHRSAYLACCSSARSRDRCSCRRSPARRHWSRTNRGRRRGTSSAMVSGLLGPVGWPNRYLSKPTVLAISLRAHPSARSTILVDTATSAIPVYLSHQSFNWTGIA
jgi:hypothetical protein